MVKVYSNTHFNVQIANDRDNDKGFDLIKYRVNKTEEDSTEYNLYLAVPKEITHDFESKIYIIHPSSGVKTMIPVIFKGREGSTDQYIYSSKSDGSDIFGWLSNLFSGSSSSSSIRTAYKDDEPERREPERR